MNLSHNPESEIRILNENQFLLRKEIEQNEEFVQNIKNTFLNQIEQLNEAHDTKVEELNSRISDLKEQLQGQKNTNLELE